MIERQQRIVFWCLIVCILGMAALLVVERQRDRDRIAALADTTPLDAPIATTEPVTLDLANDSDGDITAQQRQIALPDEETARARALIDHLVAEYTLPGSPHPLPPGAAVNEVFLVPLPVVGYTTNTNAEGSASGYAGNATGGSAGSSTSGSAGSSISGYVGTSPVASTDPNALQPKSPGGELAVIDLRGSFVDQHPSGVEVESLTLLSILGTLHANLPEIEQVRFLVDGQPRETLAGHADLLRTYPTRDTTIPVDIGGSQ